MYIFINIKEEFSFLSIKLNLRLKTAVAGSTYTCEQCNKSFTRKQTLHTHTHKYHPGQPSLSPYLPQEVTLNDKLLPEMFDGNIDLMNLLSPEELERIVPSPPEEDLSRLQPPCPYI